MLTSLARVPAFITDPLLKIISFVVFMLIILGLGSITYLAGWKRESILERLTITIGAGLVMIPVAGAFFDTVGIPVSYISFLILALAVSLTVAELSRRSLKEIEKPEPVTKHDGGALTIFALTLALYLHGSLCYSWFENCDPWYYTATVKFIALFKTYKAPFMFTYVTAPYPQGYQTLFAIANQITPSINWVMKFYNAYIISFSILYFYFLACRMTKKRSAALFATLCLASMPAWLSHFIFALSFGVSLVPLFIYFLVRMEDSPKWEVPATLCFASFWLIHFYTAFIVTLILILYYAVSCLIDNSIKKNFVRIVVLGGVFGLIFHWIPWAFRSPHNTFHTSGIDGMVQLARSLIPQPYLSVIGAVMCIIIFIIYRTSDKWVPVFMSHMRKLNFPNVKPVLYALALFAVIAILNWPKKLMDTLGTTSIKYNLNHFINFDNRGNYIQTPFGIGIIPFIFCIVALIYVLRIYKDLFTKPNRYLAITTTLLIFSFLGVIGRDFLINLAPFRMWSYLAFTVSLMMMAAYKIIILNGLTRPVIRMAAVTILTISLLISWAGNKYIVNASQWNDEWLGSYQSHELFEWVRDNLPKNSKAYFLGCPQIIPLAYDMISPIWETEIFEYHKIDIEQTLRNNYDFLKKNGYEYVIVDPAVAITRIRHLYFDYPERRSLFMLDCKRFGQRMATMRNLPQYFKPVKEVRNGGTVFKVL